MAILLNHHLFVLAKWQFILLVSSVSIKNKLGKSIREDILTVPWSECETKVLTIGDWTSKLVAFELSRHVALWLGPGGQHLIDIIKALIVSFPWW